MGRLQRLELENFKSYAGTQVIGPFLDFTCVVGPNGAGKSNLMDAISFVLGLQSRQLRSTNLKDVIFHRDESSKPRRAAVRLIYVMSEGELEGFREGEAVCFSRTVNGQGISSYAFQNQTMTYEDYDGILQKIGVLVRVRNFLVFQGDIEAVASKTPAEITSLFEQICGSDSLIKDFEATQRQKEEAEEKTMFAMSKKKMFAAQNKEVKAQRDEANLFSSKQQEVKELQTQLLALQLYQLHQEMKKQEGALEGLFEQTEENREAEKGIEAEIADAKKAMANTSKQQTTLDKKLSGVKKKLEALTLDTNHANNKSKILNKRKKDVEKDMENTKVDMVEQDNYVSTLKTKIHALEQQLSVQKAELESMEEQQDIVETLSSEDLKEYQALKSQSDQETRLLHKKFDGIAAQTQLISSQRDTLVSQVQNLTKEIENGNAMLTDYTVRRAHLVSSTTAYEQEIQRINTEKASFSTQVLRLEKQLQDINTELASVQSKLAFYGSERSKVRQNTRLNEALIHMKALYPGIHGKLIDLCKPIQKKYHIAVNIVLNKHFDAIIVDSKETASACIGYLKEHHVGTSTFLPLDSIQPVVISQRFKDNLSNKYKLCIDILEYDPAFKSAIMYAVGNTVLCEGLEEAQELAFGRGEQVKIVTLKGHVISKSGAMTGGHTQELSRDRFQESEINALQAQKATLESKKNALEQELHAHQSVNVGKQTLQQYEQNIRALHAKIHYNKMDLNLMETKIINLQGQLQQKVAYVDEVNKNAASFNHQFQGLQDQAAQVKAEMANVEKTIFVNCSNRAYIESYLTAQATQQQHRTLLQQQLQNSQSEMSSLTSQLNYESSKQFSNIYNKLAKQLEITSQEIKDLNNSLIKLKSDEEKELHSKQGIVKELRKLEEEKELHMSVLKDLMDKKQSLHAENGAVLKSIHSLEITIEKLRNLLHNLLTNAAVDQVPLPYKDGEMDVDEPEQATTRTVRTEDEENASSVQFSDADNPVVRRDRELLERLDLSSAKKTLRGAHAVADREAKEQAIREEIVALQSEVASMQPNLHAAQRYEESLQKLNEVQQEVDTYRETARTCGIQFEELRKKRLELFNAAFQHISKNLSQIYRDLTRSSKHPLGGNAYLTLDNTDEPYLAGVRFTAMPPMKRFRDMEQLSGGEKTVAALALLFAIHSFRPAPFFVLDEIDAALDNVNVKKVCNYIAQRSVELQCIVISLKDIFFEHAHSLVGIAKDLPTASSKAFTLDLRQFTAAAQDLSLDQTLEASQNEASHAVEEES